MATNHVGRTKVDNEKELELIDQWTMLLLERSVLLKPKPGSGVPGAPTRWKMASGMESRVITLYLDLNGMLYTVYCHTLISEPGHVHMCDIMIHISYSAKF